MLHDEPLETGAAGFGRADFPEDPKALRDSLLKAVESIAAPVSASARESESSRTLAPAAVAALRDSGLARMKSPRTVGGAEADPIVQMEVVESLTRIDSAAGWALLIARGIGARVLSTLPDEVIDEMSAPDGVPFFAGSLKPDGMARAVERCVGLSRLGLGRADATSDVGRLLDPEEARGVPAEDLFALRVAEVSHRPLDRRRGVGPSAFVVRVVVGPHEVVHEVVLNGERQPRAVLAEQRESLSTVVEARRRKRLEAAATSVGELKALRKIAKELRARDPKLAHMIGW